MDDEAFPPNTHVRRSREPEKSEKVVEKVTTGVVARRKKPFRRKLAEVFVADDAQSVGSYILFDILIPSAKDVIADVVSQAIERTLFGGSRSPRSRASVRPGGSAGHVSYNRYSSPAPWNRGREEQRPTVSRRARAAHDFDEIILATRGEAEEVVDRLFDLVARYQQATVADLYELVGISGNFTDEKWGWTDIRGAGVTRISSSGYLLDLPKPELLD